MLTIQAACVPHPISPECVIDAAHAIDIHAARVVNVGMHLSALQLLTSLHRPSIVECTHTKSFDEAGDVSERGRFHEIDQTGQQQQKGREQEDIVNRCNPVRICIPLLGLLVALHVFYVLCFECRDLAQIHGVCIEITSHHETHIFTCILLLT
jgi:hypothetical protein